MLKPSSYLPKIQLDLEFAGKSVSFNSKKWVEQAEQSVQGMLRTRSSRRDFTPAAVVPEEDSAIKPFSERALQVRFPYNH